jgi:hypothetical protein
MDLQRFVRQLIASIEARDPTGLHRPITVAELRERILPYRFHRTALRLSSNEDYELLVLRLVAEDGGWVRTSPAEAAEKARAEIASPNPDLDLTEILADATVQLGASAVARIRLEAGEARADATPAAPPPAPVESPAVDPPVASPVAPAVAEAETIAAPQPSVSKVEPAPQPPAPPPPPRSPIPLFDALDDTLDLVPPPEPPPMALPTLTVCPRCAGSLPTDRPVVYCPHCGERVGTLRCVRCGTELEPGWRHCVMCGHRSPGVDTALA